MFLSDSQDAADCKSGCQCPPGLLDDGLGSCVRESECTCQHDGSIYATGSKIVNECNNWLVFFFSYYFIAIVQLNYVSLSFFLKTLGNKYGIHVCLRYV